MSIKMIIEISDAGVKVEGPIENKPLCKAIIAGAEEIIEHPEKYKVTNSISRGPSMPGPVRSN